MMIVEPQQPHGLRKPGGPSGSNRSRHTPEALVICCVLFFIGRMTMPFSSYLYVVSLFVLYWSVQKWTIVLAVLSLPASPKPTPLFTEEVRFPPINRDHPLSDLYIFNGYHLIFWLREAEINGSYVARLVMLRVFSFSHLLQRETLKKSFYFSYSCCTFWSNSGMIPSLFPLWAFFSS